MVKPELDSSIDYYRALGITASCTQVDIRKAFLELARTQHPDKNPGHEAEFKAKFQAITTAYDVLKDPASKRTYDQVRPVASKGTPKSTPVSRSFASASAKAATEAAARASAFPRQAKTTPKSAPKSPPKKTQARPDPFNSWTPPVPPSKSTPKPSATSTSYTKDKFTAEPRGSGAYPRRAPTAPQSSYNPSPGGVGRGAAPKMPTKPTTSSKNAAPRQPRTQASPKENWAKDGWWGQSNTAYSTFHGPSSKYSPYAEEPKSASMPNTSDTTGRPTDGYFAKSAFEHVHKKSTSATNADHAGSRFTDHYKDDETNRKKAGHEYDWQKSRSAYQSPQSSHSASERSQSKRTARRPFSEGLRAGNPFFEARSRGGFSLDSDLIDDFSDDDDDVADRMSKRYPPFSATKDRNRKPRGSDKLQDSSDDEPEMLRSDSDLGNRDRLYTQPSSKAAQADAKRSYRAMPTATRSHKSQEGFAKYRSTTGVAEKEDREQSERTSEQTKPEPANDTKKSFAFTFNHAPNMLDPTASLSRKSSGNVPYVHFNHIPDLDFTSPGATPDIASPVFTGQSNVFDTVHKEGTPSAARTKHPRANEHGDPRFPTTTETKSAQSDCYVKPADNVSTATPVCTSPSPSASKSTLEEGLDKMDIADPKAQDMKAAEAGAGFKAPVFEFGASTIRQPFSFNSPATNSATSAFKFTFPSPIKARQASVSPPCVPAELLQPLNVAVEDVTEFSKAYIARSQKLNSYLATWHNYQSLFWLKASSLPASDVHTDEVYLAAVRRQIEVLATQQAIDSLYVAYAETKLQAQEGPIN